MPQQTLHTERITLVPLADEHFEWERELDSDPEVMRHISGRASTLSIARASFAVALLVNLLRSRTHASSPLPDLRPLRA